MIIPTAAAAVEWAAWAAWICKSFELLWQHERPRFGGAFLFDAMTIVDAVPLRIVQVCCNRAVARH